MIFICKSITLIFTDYSFDFAVIRADPKFGIKNQDIKNCILKNGVISSLKLLSKLKVKEMVGNFYNLPTFSVFQN